MSKEMKLLTIAGISVVTLAIITLVGFAIITQTGVAMRSNTAVVNEVFTPTNNTGISLTNTFIRAGTTTVINNTGTTVPDSAFRVDLDAGVIVPLDFSGTYGNQTNTWNATYTYGAANDVSTTATLFLVGIVLFASFITLVVLVIVGKTVMDLIKDKK